MEPREGIRIWRAVAVAAVVAACAVVGASRATAQSAPDSTDRVLLEVVDAALKTAAQTPAPWPGYDAAANPFVVYRPGRWRILLNPPTDEPDVGWTTYSPPWPELPRPAWLDPDGDPDLVGQLAFDYEAPGGLVAAVPLYDDLSPENLFSFVVHESFHQFQRHHFADVNTPSEEGYPTLDPENNALAALEFLALRDAVKALGSGDADGARDRARIAVAIHATRTDSLGEEARTIESSKEVVEGTAKYVETQLVAGFAGLCRSGAVAGLDSLCRSFEGIDASTYLADDFNERLTEGAIAPADMARNRIYPVAAAVAFLLDVYEPGWKEAVEKDGTSRGLFDHLDAALGAAAGERAELVARAQSLYGWKKILASSRARVREYLDGFERTMSEFDAQTGDRLSVRLGTSGVSRSRSKREQSWVVDAGRRTLGRFVVYTLRRISEPPLELSLENVMVLDETDGQGHRTVTVCVPPPLSIMVDGESLPADFVGTRTFHQIAVESSDATLHTSLPGTLTMQAGKVRVELRSPAR
jgi:hypothetical protein